jgi:hypothetical protein
MAEKVTVRGGQDDGAQFENAATEATLLRLVALLEASGNTAGANAATQMARNSANAQNTQTTAVQQNTASTKKSTTAIQSLAGAVINLSSAIGGLVGAILGKTVGAVVSFASNLLEGNTRLSEFTQDLEGLPILGLFHKLAVFLDDNLDTWRNLSTVGAAFNNSIFDMRRAAATAEMSVDAFAKTIQENSPIIKLLGQSATTGAFRFADLSKQLRTSKIGNQMMGMGMTIDDINDSMITYMDIQARSGRLQRMSTGQLISGSADLAMEMDLLSKATGLNRKDLEKQLKEASVDPQWKSAMMRLDENSKKVAEMSYAAIASASPKLGEAFKDLIDGVPQTEIGEALAKQAPEVAEIFKRIGAGGIKSSEQAYNEIQKALEGTSNRLENAFSPAQISALRNAGGAFAATVDASEALTEGFLGFSGNFKKAAEEQNDGHDYVTQSLSRFEQSILSIRGKIEDTLLGTKVFDRLLNKLKVGGDSFENFSETLLDKVMPTILQFSNWLTDFVDDLTDPNKNIKDVLMSYLKVAFDNIKSGIETGVKYIFDLPDDAKIGETFKNWFNNQFLDILSKIANSFIDKVKGFFIKPSEGGTTAGAEGGSFFDQNFNWKNIGLAAGAAVGVTALAVALSGLSAPAIATGAAIAAIALSMSSLVESLTKFQEVSIRSIESLANIPAGTFTQSAAGINELAKALDNFTPGLWSSLTKGLGELIGGSTVKELTEMGNAGAKVQYLADVLKQVDFNHLDASAVDFDAFEDGAKKVEQLSSKLNGLKKSMNEISMPSITATFEDAMKKISEAISQLVPDDTAPDATATALTNLGTKLDQMNMSLAELTRVQHEALPNIKKTARNTKNPNVL